MWVHVWSSARIMTFRYLLILFETNCNCSYEVQNTCQYFSLMNPVSVLHCMVMKDSLRNCWAGFYSSGQNIYSENCESCLTELSPWPLVGLCGVFGTLCAPLPPNQFDTHPVTPWPLSSSICR